MPVIILFVFIAVPIAEIAVFIEAGEQFGLWPTLGLVILTAVIGTALLRHQGLQTIQRVQLSLERGEMPVGEVFTGLCLLVAGALLLTPGFLTDGIGFALFVPAVRRLLGGFAVRALSARGTIWVDGQDRAGNPQYPRQEPRTGHRHDTNGTIIDGDFTEVPKTPPEEKNLGPTHKRQDD
jgi:UPF0716 protein FxsA